MDAWQMWAGPSKHFLVFPVRHGTMVNYVGFVPTDEEMKESWSAPGDPQVLRREFEGWDPRIGQVLAQVDKTFRWALYDREPLPTWSHGRLTLLGDAAHPMLPHLGQGANQSIEDGMALATILARADRSAVPQALLAYDRLRRERVAEVQLGARQHGLRVDSAAGDLRVRDEQLRRTPNSASSSTRTTWCRLRTPPRRRADSGDSASAGRSLTSPARSSSRSRLTRSSSSRDLGAVSARASHSPGRCRMARSLAPIAGALTACSIAATSAVRAASGIPAGAKKPNQMPNRSSRIAELAHRGDVSELAGIRCDETRPRNVPTAE